jgi:nicotinamidase/pyrazinamidase
MKALLLVDLQNDFMPGGPLAVPNAFACIAAANQAQKFFASVIASRDWHPNHHMSFVTEHKGKKVGDLVEVDGLMQTLWPSHCVKHTSGAAFVKGLDQKRIRFVVSKGEDPLIDSYSAFFDNAHRRETGLRSYLELSGIDELFVLGVATDYCVKFTALDAASLGIKTHVIIDACRGIGLNNNDITNAIEEMRKSNINIILLADLPKYM